MEKAVCDRHVVFYMKHSVSTNCIEKCRSLAERRCKKCLPAMCFKCLLNTDTPFDVHAFRHPLYSANDFSIGFDSSHGYGGKSNGIFPSAFLSDFSPV